MVSQILFSLFIFIALSFTWLLWRPGSLIYWPNKLTRGEAGAPRLACVVKYSNISWISFSSSDITFTTWNRVIIWRMDGWMLQIICRRRWMIGTPLHSHCILRVFKGKLAFILRRRAVVVEMEVVEGGVFILGTNILLCCVIRLSNWIKTVVSSIIDRLIIISSLAHWILVFPVWWTCFIKIMNNVGMQACEGKWFKLNWSLDCSSKCKTLPNESLNSFVF